LTHTVDLVTEQLQYYTEYLPAQWFRLEVDIPDCAGTVRKSVSTQRADR